MAFVTALALAALASLSACSEGKGVVPLDEERCWPELSEGQRVAGNVRIYMSLYSTVAYSPACDGGALMIAGDTLLDQNGLPSSASKPPKTSLRSAFLPTFLLKLCAVHGVD